MQDLRRSYEYGTITKLDLLSDPIAQFKKWFDNLLQLENPKWFEPNAMTLSTAEVINGGQARVTSRIVLLKYIDDDSFVFFTNYRSEKANQLQANAHASLNFHWDICDQQVRVEGIVSKTDAAVSNKYFHARPIASQLGAIASPQSEVIADDLDLSMRLKEIEKEYQGREIPRPDHWGGYRLKPETIEFWQGKPSRLHDRFRYRREDDGAWKIERLAP
ncbi:MAG: pyridoxamine 5'-phosphate oxidase [Planctomycetota bacterium]|nr:pyridoxamine 5'-phosphate oxidase [Planctomycetota bacterium]